jgi:hypothetical protein
VLRSNKRRSGTLTGGCIRTRRGEGTLAVLDCLRELVVSFCSRTPGAREGTRLTLVRPRRDLTARKPDGPPASNPGGLHILGTTFCRSR